MSILKQKYSKEGVFIILANLKSIFPSLILKVTFPYFMLNIIPVVTRKVISKIIGIS